MLFFARTYILHYVSLCYFIFPSFVHIKIYHGKIFLVYLQLCYLIIEIDLFAYDNCNNNCLIYFTTFNFWHFSKLISKSYNSHNFSLRVYYIRLRTVIHERHIIGNISFYVMKSRVIWDYHSSRICNAVLCIFLIVRNLSHYHSNYIKQLNIVPLHLNSFAFSLSYFCFSTWILHTYYYILT